MGKFAKSIRISFRTWHPMTCSPGAMGGGERMGHLVVGAVVAVAYNGGIILLTSLAVGAGSKWERIKCQSQNLGALLVGAMSTAAFTALLDHIG